MFIRWTLAQQVQKHKPIFLSRISLLQFLSCLMNDSQPNAMLVHVGRRAAVVEVAGCRGGRPCWTGASGFPAGVHLLRQQDPADGAGQDAHSCQGERAGAGMSIVCSRSQEVKTTSQLWQNICGSKACQGAGKRLRCRVLCTARVYSVWPEEHHLLVWVWDKTSYKQSISWWFVTFHFRTGNFYGQLFWPELTTLWKLIMTRCFV